MPIAEVHREISGLLGGPDAGRCTDAEDVAALAALAAVPQPNRRHPGQFVGHYLGLGSWAERTIILLVMQTHDNSLTVSTKRGGFGRVRLPSMQGHGRSNPTWIPAANEAIRRLAKQIGGTAGGG